MTGAGTNRYLGGAGRHRARDRLGSVYAISGGRLVPIEGGIELPVSHGYRVRVVLAAADDYTVSRVFRRNGKEWAKGQRTHVHCDQVGEAAYNRPVSEPTASANGLENTNAHFC